MKLLSRFIHLFFISKHLVKMRAKRLTSVPLVFRLRLRLKLGGPVIMLHRV